MLLIIPIQTQQQPGTGTTAFFGLNFGLKNAACRWISEAFAGMKKGPQGPFFNDLQTPVDVCKT
ncbi:MAG: hypothetical protein J0H09_29375 [Burkholderiales bacterium]|nr:hypothetical protein [Burkholderiales bacterium]